MRRQRGRTMTRRFRVARFEQLEWRHLLAAGGVTPAISNLAITTDPKAQQMPSLAVDPHDANHLGVAYMDFLLVTTRDAGVGVAGWRGAGGGGGDSGEGGCAPPYPSDA